MGRKRRLLPMDKCQLTVGEEWWHKNTRTGATTLGTAWWGIRYTCWLKGKKVTAVEKPDPQWSITSAAISWHHGPSDERHQGRPAPFLEDSCQITGHVRHPNWGAVCEVSGLSLSLDAEKGWEILKRCDNWVILSSTLDQGKEIARRTWNWNIDRVPFSDFDFWFWLWLWKRMSLFFRNNALKCLGAGRYAVSSSLNLEKVTCVCVCAFRERLEGSEG